MSAAYYVYVENADRSFAKAIAAGATKIFDPTDMPYEDRQAGVIDPFGNIGWISQRLVAHSYD
jgi:PhnB protein